MEENIGIWQRRLIPLMVGIVVLSAIFFAATSIREFERVHATLSPPKAALAPLMASFDRLPAASFEEGLAIANRKAEIYLETEAMSRRYEQSHAIILARVWTRFMAFTTGTILALIGAAFILGKLRETQTSLSGTGGGAQFALASASPGIVLATLGTILILAAIFSYFEVHTTDVPTYTKSGMTIGSDILESAPPAPPGNASSATPEAGPQAR